MSIPGIGDVTAARLLAEIPNMLEFKSGKEIAAFAGLSPQRFRSGTSVRKSANEQNRQFGFAATAVLPGGHGDASQPATQRIRDAASGSSLSANARCRWRRNGDVASRGKPRPNAPKRVQDGQTNKPPTMSVVSGHDGQRSTCRVQAWIVVSARKPRRSRIGRLVSRASTVRYAYPCSRARRARLETKVR